MKLNNSSIKNTSSGTKIFGWLMLVLGIINVVYFISGLLIGWGAYFGMLFILVVGIAFINMGAIRVLNLKNIFGTRFKKLIKLFKYAIILLTTSFIIIEGLIIYSGNSEDNAKADYLLILGAGLFGETPSPELRERLNKGLEYMNKNPQSTIIVSGGKGSGENITEAEAMKRYLVKHGISESRIIKEEKSTSTFENIKFTKEIIENFDKRDNPSLAIVSNDFHLFRAKFLAKRHGFTAYGYPARTPLWIIPNHYVREYFAVIKSALLDRS